MPVQTRQDKLGRGESIDVAIGGPEGGVYCVLRFHADRLEVIPRGQDCAPLTFSQRGGRVILRELERWLQPRRKYALMGRAEIQDAFGISTAAFAKWRRDKTFPKPAAELRAGPVWARAAVLVWAKRYRGRSPLPGRVRDSRGRDLAQRD